MSKTLSETTCTGYDFADLYDREEAYWWSKARRGLVCRLIKKFARLSHMTRILDVGCGGGALLGSLEGNGRIYGLEYSISGAVCAAARTSANIVRGDAGELPFKDKGFDVLTSLDVIEHLDDDAKALKGFYRVLSDDGVMVLMVPALNILWSPRDVTLGHKRRYSKKNLRSLVEDTGFEVVRCSYTNTFYFPGLLLYSLMKRFTSNEIKPKGMVLSVPSPLSFLFSLLLKIEEKILMISSLPIGTSIMCVAKKGKKI